MLQYLLLFVFPASLPFLPVHRVWQKAVKNPQGSLWSSEMFLSMYKGDLPDLLQTLNILEKETTRRRVEDSVLSLLNGKTNPTGSWTELCSEHGTKLYMLSGLKFHKDNKKRPLLLIFWLTQPMFRSDRCWEHHRTRHVARNTRMKDANCLNKEDNLD